MLAYYINLINQQEKEEQKEQQPIERKSVSSKKVEETTDSKLEEESATKERHTSPKKPAKWLAREEAERIIATILEKRPGRAEFSVPQILEKKKKERKSEEHNTMVEEKFEQHNSEVVVAEKKAEPASPLVVEAVAAPRKRGRPRKSDPFKVVDQALDSKEIPDAPIEVESKPRVPVGGDSVDVFSSFPVGGNLEAGNADNSLSSVKTTLEIEKEAPQIAFGTISSSGRGKKKKSKSMSVETKLGETVTLGAVPDTKETSFIVDVEESNRRHSKWWRKPVALDIVPYEVELEKSLHELRSVYEAQLMSHLVDDGQHNRPSLASRMLVVFPFR